MPRPDGYKVNTLGELKEHFDINSAVFYFIDGTLLRWLKARKYNNEAAQVEKLSRLDRDLAKKLCAIFGTEGEGETIPTWIIEIMNRLKQITGDKNLLKQIEQELIDGKAHIAFNQTELNEHVKKFNKIYLASSEFVIPLNMAGKTYIGVGERAVALIKSDKPVDIDRLHIKLESIRIEGSIEGGGGELDEIERLISSGATKGTYMYKMQVLKKKYIELKDSKSLRKLGDLYKKVPEGLMAEDCYREADWIDKPSKPQPPVKEPKPNTPPEHFKKRFKEIEDLFDKPHKSNDGIIKALDELEKMVATQRYRNEMEWVAYYYVRIHEDKKAKECLDKAETFPRPQPTPPPSPKPKPKPPTPPTQTIPQIDIDKKLRQLLNNYKTSSKADEKRKFENACIAVDEQLKKDHYKTRTKEIERQRFLLFDSAFSESIEEQIEICGSAPQAIIDICNSMAKSYYQAYAKDSAEDICKIGGLLARYILEHNISVPSPTPSKKPTLFIGDKDIGKSQFTVEFGWKGIETGWFSKTEKKVPMMAGTLLLGDDNKLTQPENFVYGDDQHPSGCIQCACNLDKCIQIKIDLAKIPENISRLVFLLGTEDMRQTFNDLSYVYIRIIGPNIINTKKTDRIKYAESISLASIIRQGKDWKLEFISATYNESLMEVAGSFMEGDTNDINNPTTPTGKPNAKTETKIRNRKGIHARPASVFVEKASSFKSAIQLEAKGKTVDAKSILMIMSLGLFYGTPVTISAWGPDAFEAVNELRKLIESGCGED